METFANVYDAARTVRITRIRIGDWVLDRSDGTLTGGHATVRLEPKVLDVLLHLVEHQGAVVLHEDLLRDVWKGTHVVPGALARTISLLRTALGDDAYRPTYIETVPKRGYRLIARVEELPRARDLTFLRPLAIAAAAGVLLLVVSHDQRPMHMMHGAGWMAFDHQTRVGNETAFEHYARAVDRYPGSAEAHAGLATAYVFRANYLPDRDRWAFAAVESAKRAISLDDENAVAAHAAGMAHLQAGRLREAEPYFRRAMELNPGDMSAPLNLARLLMIRGDADAAVALARRRVETAPDTPSYTHLAQALWAAGRRTDAVAAARRAVDIEPFAREPRMLLIGDDILSGNFAAATAALLRLLTAHPDCTQCVVQLGLIEQRAGNLAAAETRYRQAMAMPPFPGARLRLAHVLSLTGRTKEAAALLRQVEQAASSAIDGASAEFPHPRWNIAAAAAIAGDRAAALRWYGEARRLGRRDVTWDAFDPVFDGVRPLPFETVAVTP